ncbi:MAG: adenylate/guanylate cyclase domain-containing protein [Bacteroidota bacterium]
MSTRRLAAIMFTDIAGYTAMMQADESKAMQVRQRHRQVFEQYHQEYQGTILQYFGDGTLSIFDSAIDAVKCGIDMQAAFQQEPHVPLRIGIHTGDILYSADEVAGDGVNVASRVESLAVPGSVFLSESVYGYLKNQVEIPVQSMGEFSFKNVEEPMEVYAVAREELVIPEPKNLTGKFIKHRRPGQQSLLQRMPIWAKYVGGFALFLLLAPIIYFPLLQITSSSAAEEQGDMIVVTDEMGHTSEHMMVKAEDKTRFYLTPFDNATGDSSLNWMTRGFPYALGMDWDQDPFVFSIFSELAKPKSLNEEIDNAKKYNCEYVLKGRVEQTDSSYRIHINTYRVDNGHMKSGQVYEHSDIFSLLDTVSLNTKLAMGISPEHLAHVKDLPIRQFLTHSETAFEHFGWALYNRIYVNFFPLKSIEAAIEADSTFAWMCRYGSYMNHRYHISKKNAEKLSFQAMRHRKRLPKDFEAEIRQLHYQVTGQPEKALQLAEIQVKLHPDNSDYQRNLISGYFLRDQYEKALEVIGNIRNMTDNPEEEVRAEYMSLWRLGKIEAAISIVESYLSSNPDVEESIVELGLLYTQAQEWDKATNQIEQAILMNPEDESYPRLLKYVQFAKDSLPLKPANWFKEFEGRYWIKHYASFEMQVVEMNGNLLTQATNQSKFQLFPIGSDLFTGMIDYREKFVRDDRGRVIGTETNDMGYSIHPSIRIPDEMLRGIELFRERKFSEARPILATEAKGYPDHLFLSRMVQYIDFRTDSTSQEDRQTYTDLEGTYVFTRNESIILTLSLDEQGQISYTNNQTSGRDPNVLYEFEKDHFMSLVSLGSTFQFRRKHGRIVELTVWAKDDEMVFKKQ